MKRFFLLFVLLGMIAGGAWSADPSFGLGPYLLGPKPTSMVVMWESTEKTDATIAFGTDANSLGTPVAVVADPDAPFFQGVQMNLFCHKLSNLQPGTRYYYEVKLSGGETRRASFKTLEENPAKVTVISVSDTHVFTTRKKFNQAARLYQPDFIIHCGDMLEGTGAQADELVFWFQSPSEDDFIHSFPVIYASGNHDQGGEYPDAFIYNIQDAEYGAAVPGNSSLNHGNIHFQGVNSNPWGLFQLNVEATGNKADPATMDLIERTKNWMQTDLASDAATQAEFRLTFMHHPKSDRYTDMHVPAIIEPGGVDVMLAGHSHAYARHVSDNPAVGAGTVYLTHQDARLYNKKGNFFLITSVPGEGTLTIEAYGAENADADIALAASTVIAAKKQQLAFSDVSITPNEVLYNEAVTISATVRNAGDGLAAAALPVSDNGETRYVYTFGGAVKLLEPGQSAALTGTLKMESLGTHVLRLGDTTANVETKFRPATYHFANLRTRMGDGEEHDIDSNRLSIKADISNIGNEAGTAVAEFTIDGTTIATKNYRLASDEKKTVEFFHTFDRAGEYEVAIGDAPPQKIYVEGSIQGMPIVRDKSGNGNFAYIHGTPKLGVDDRGRQTVILDGRRDYLEIPDNGGYTVDSALSGMVWANLPSAGTTKGGVSELVEKHIDLGGRAVVLDHNPLMMKGISIGWGTPYLIRMAVRETGKMTYGTCLFDDNGEFQWTDGSQPEAGIKKDTWVQYTSTLDFESGGDSYQNGYHSGHVGKPAFTAKVKNWEGAPMYIGLGFKNTLWPGRNRGMYYTMLPGAISQIRFYTTKVSAAENDNVRNNPESAGADARDLKIWLDFESANIDTRGVHTTEWVETTAAITTLSASASFTGNASITAVIQTSDDTTTVKEQKEIPIRSGATVTRLSGIQPARYVRIQTVFLSDLNTNESSLPVLNEYVLTAGATTRWNTFADWKKGIFEGAVGHQSSDVYRMHFKDFDNYSGQADSPDAQ